jgi:hypothetical protein
MHLRSLAKKSIDSKAQLTDAIAPIDAKNEYICGVFMRIGCQLAEVLLRIYS